MRNVPPGIQTIPGRCGLYGALVVRRRSSAICDFIFTYSFCLPAVDQTLGSFRWSSELSVRRSAPFTLPPESMTAAWISAAQDPSLVRRVLWLCGLGRGRRFATSSCRGHLFQRLIDSERGRLLTWWELRERRQKWADDGLCGHDHVGLGQVPVVVGVRGNVGSLEGIGPKVVEFRTA